MKWFSKERYHELFRISILVKGVDGLLESLGGLFVYFSTYTSINRLLISIFYEELATDPRNTFWGYFIHEWRAFDLPARAFWGLLFVAHGLVKLFLSVMLLKNKVWAYPLAAVIFAAFAMYESYMFFYQSSLALGVFALFDITVSGLTLYEYHYIKKNRTRVDAILLS
jgi:uncharacterized membrane protein